MSVKITRRIKSPGSLSDSTLPALLQTIFANRGISSEQELELKLTGLLPISSLGGTLSAAKILAESLAKLEKIVIVADFDADGATSCALMCAFLQSLGADVAYIVPDRAKHGYGLSVQIVEEVLKLAPQLVMTVDNGISSVAGVELAKKHGLKVIVSDHHLPPDKFPPADVIVNPNNQGEVFASKNLAGVGVAFYIICAVHQQLIADNWYQKNKRPPANPADYLDLVALGTIADVVTLDKNNRILVENGLQRMRSARTRPGIEALFSAAGRDIKHARTSDLGFAIAPKINAAGRMDDMSVGIECLLAQDKIRAEQLASWLNEINEVRKTVEADMQQQADKILVELQTKKDLPHGLCLFGTDWHEGVVGIVAGRLKQKFSRPVIVFAKSGDMLKGSARSIKCLNMRDCLENISRKHERLLDKFGGHAMAAGLSIKPDDYDKFRIAFEHETKSLLADKVLEDAILSDLELEAKEFNLALAERLQTIAPWGQGFEEPIFDGIFEVQNSQVVAQKHLKLVLKPQKSNVLLDAIAFNQSPDVLAGFKPLKFAYQMGVNRWRGNVSLQLRVLHIQQVSQP